MRIFSNLLKKISISKIVYVFSIFTYIGITRCDASSKMNDNMALIVISDSNNLAKETTTVIGIMNNIIDTMCKPSNNAGIMHPLLSDFLIMYTEQMSTKINRLVNEPETDDIFSNNSNEERILRRTIQSSFGEAIGLYLKNRYILFNDNVDYNNFLARNKEMHRNICIISELISNNLSKLSGTELNFFEEGEDLILLSKMQIRMKPSYVLSVDRVFILNSFLDSFLRGKDVFNLGIKSKSLIGELRDTSDSVRRTKNNLDYENFRKLTYIFYDDQNINQPSSEITMIEKSMGVQFGSKMIYTVHEKKESGTISESKDKVRTFFVKTHQEGQKITGTSDFFTSTKSSKGARPVDLKEMFAYKFLEFVGIGSKSNFIVNPNFQNNLFIVTEDVSYTDISEAELQRLNVNDKIPVFLVAKATVGKMIGEKQKKIIDCYVSDKKDGFKENFTMATIQQNIAEKLINEVFKMDLLARILNISDLNESNYGFIAIKNKDTEEYSIDEKFFSLKIIDLLPPSSGGSRVYTLDEETFITNFISGNGKIYATKSFARDVLGNFSSKDDHTEDENEQRIGDKFKRASILLSSPEIQQGKLHRAVELAEQSVKDFLEETDSLTEKKNFEIVGMIGNKGSEMSEDFDLYIKAVSQNIDSVNFFVQKRLNSISQK